METISSISLRSSMSICFSARISATLEAGFDAEQAGHGAAVLGGDNVVDVVAVDGRVWHEDIVQQGGERLGARVGNVRADIERRCRRRRWHAGAVLLEKSRGRSSNRRPQRSTRRLVLPKHFCPVGRHLVREQRLGPRAQGSVFEIRKLPNAERIEFRRIHALGFDGVEQHGDARRLPQQAFKDFATDGGRGAGPKRQQETRNFLVLLEGERACGGEAHGNARFFFNQRRKGLFGDRPRGVGKQADAVEDGVFSILFGIAPACFSASSSAPFRCSR